MNRDGTHSFDREDFVVLRIGSNQSHGDTFSFPTDTAPDKNFTLDGYFCWNFFHAKKSRSISQDEGTFLAEKIGAIEDRGEEEDRFRREKNW